MTARRPRTGSNDGRISLPIRDLIRNAMMTAALRGAGKSEIVQDVPGAAPKTPRAAGARQSLPELERRVYQQWRGEHPRKDAIISKTGAKEGVKEGAKNK
jgi:hypothetical protein